MARCMPRIAVDPLSLTQAARRLTATARELEALATSFPGRVSSVGAAGGSREVEAAFGELRQAWSRSLRDLTSALGGLAHNTDAAAVVYEAADQLRAPARPATPVQHEQSPRFPWLAPVDA